MRKLVVIEFLSLDGVMQAPGAPDEDRDGGFRHGGWALPYYDEVMVGAAVEGMEETDAFLFGRRTYQTFAAYWPTAPTEIPFTAKLNSTPKYVASTTLERVEWENSTLLEGDVPSAVADLKRRNGKNIAILGSSGLVQTLIGQDLIDEYSLTVHPIVLGGGKRLFRDDGQLRKMQLVDSKTTSMGSLLLTYHPRLTRRSKGSGEPPAGVVTSIEHLIRSPFTATRPSPVSSR